MASNLIEIAIVLVFIISEVAKRAIPKLTQEVDGLGDNLLAIVYYILWQTISIFIVYTEKFYI